MNKKELQYVKDNYFQSAIDLSLIMETIDEVQEEKEAEQEKISAARFYKTALRSFKAPTEQAGELGTEERQRFQKYITRNVRGNTLSEKISSINEIVAGTRKEDAKISEIMGALGAVKMLQQTLDDFNESTAGFCLAYSKEHRLLIESVVHCLSKIVCSLWIPKRERVVSLLV